MTDQTSPGWQPPGQPLTAPGKALTFTRTSIAELAFEEEVASDAPPVPAHVHLRQSERFTVLEGTLSVTLAGRTRLLTVGQTVTVPAGARHTYANGGDDVLRIEVALFPALGAQRMFESLYGLQRSGRLPPKASRDLMALAALCHEHGFYFGPVPVWALRQVMALGAGLAALFGVTAWHPDYAAPPLLHSAEVPRRHMHL